MSSRFISNNIRLAVITDVDSVTGKIRTVWDGQVGVEGPTVPAPQPYCGVRGEGIFVGAQKGMIVAFGVLDGPVYVPLAIIPQQRRSSFDLTAISELNYNASGVPNLKGGEVSVNSQAGSYVKLDQFGHITIKNRQDEGIFIGNSPDISHNCLIKSNLPTEYIISSAGISVNGIVRRDLRPNATPYRDSLYAHEYEYALEEVGWNPIKDVSYPRRESKVPNANKNPALVENRDVVLEFGRAWAIGTQDEEKKDISKQKQPSIYDRSENRSDVLDISFVNPNILIETIRGTVVDICGNLLDINKAIIPLPKEDDKFIDTVFENMRHTIALSVEINARKGWMYNEVGHCVISEEKPVIDSSFNNARDRSKWSFRVDKEGLTFLNIPASSETGNIVRLTRSETSNAINYNPSDENNKKINIKDKQDIFLEQVGPGGITVIGNEVKNRFENTKKPIWENDERKEFGTHIQAGTAFHNVTNVASILLKNDINKKSSDFTSIVPIPSPDPGKPAISDTINLTPDGRQNAGGRSVVINLDGSLEASIGANTIDRVSLVLDTGGGVVSHLGRDKSGRSAIIQSDGEVVFELGGYDYVGEDGEDIADTRFVNKNKNRAAGLPDDKYQFRSGKLVIRIRRSNPQLPYLPDVEDEDGLLIFDENGLTIKTNGRLNFISDSNFTIETKGQFTVKAESVELMGRQVTRKPQRI